MLSLMYYAVIVNPNGRRREKIAPHAFVLNCASVEKYGSNVYSCMRNRFFVDR